MDGPSIDLLIGERFEALSPKLRIAARYVIDNPQDVAFLSMRAAARKAGVHPGTMLRLARDLGFDRYDTFKNHFRNWLLKRQTSDFTGRAQDLRSRPDTSEAAAIVNQIIAHEQQNLLDTFDARTVEALPAISRVMLNSRRLYVLGLRSLFPVAYYFHYVCRMFMNNTILMSGVGGTVADELRDIDADDAMIVFSYFPYARDTVRAADFARAAGAKLVIVTDSKVSPVAHSGDLVVAVSTETQSLFPTIVPALAVAQAVIALLIARSGDGTMAEIAKSERQLESFGVYLNTLRER